jgi:hypothetical protein
MSGLLVSGKEVAVPELVILNPNDFAWCKLSAKNRRPRSTPWVRQIILHTTGGNWPQTLLPDKGPGGGARRIVDIWNTDPRPAGSHIIIDNDGTVVCTCDLAADAAFHATHSNMWSVGIEMYQEKNNGVHEAVYGAAIKLVPALCRIFGVQFQIPKAPYGNQPLRRMADGGEHCVGVFGHRDNTEDRGRGCPGDEIFARLAALGAELFDHDAEEDLATWKARQAELNANGANLTVDGVPGRLPSRRCSSRAARTGSGPSASSSEIPDRSAKGSRWVGHGCPMGRAWIATRTSARSTWSSNATMARWSGSKSRLRRR